MRRAIAIVLILLIAKSLPGQCPDRDFLWHRILWLRDTSAVPKEQQLNELLPYLKQIDQCAYRNDSTHALLLQRIGWLYTSRKDFSTAIEYTLKSIALVNGHRNSPSINQAHLIQTYWNLHILYDSLKLETRKSAAIDSCISIVLRLRVGYDYALVAISDKVSQLFKNGDYYGCIYYVNLGESIVLENRKSLSYAEYFETQSFPWKINSLIFLNRTSEAEALLIHKIREYEKQGDTKLLGTLYALYGSVNKEKGDSEKALYYFEKSIYYNKKIKYDRGISEALNNIGYTYSTNLHQNKMAIPYHFKALQFADRNESLNILDNIANIYVQGGNYDSAFFFLSKSL